MFKRIASSALIFGMAALAPPSLEAQTACAPRDILVAQLESRHGEVRQGAGLQNGSAVFELWSSPASGTWTIVLTRPDGLSCVMAAGEAWVADKAFEIAKQELAGPGA